jgi:hypothetical protein
MYIVVFSLAVILTELDWTAPIRNSILSQSWTFRGLFYIFIGLLEFVLHIDIHDWRGQLIPFSVVVSASFMTLVGAIYSFMGIICLKKTKDERMARYIQLMSYLQVKMIYIILFSCCNCNTFLKFFVLLHLRRLRMHFVRTT